MIGHYLLTLTADQEDRILTQHMVPGRKASEPRSRAKYMMDDGGRCLLGTAHDAWWEVAQWGFRSRMRFFSQWLGLGVGDRFDDLCHRFGTARINTLIRNRVLSNRARRTLQSPGVVAVA
jgi:hypothetical protein